MCPSLLFASKAKIQGDILRQNMSSFSILSFLLLLRSSPCITACSVSQNLTCLTDGSEEHSRTEKKTEKHSDVGLADHSAEHSLSLMHIWMKWHQRSVRYDVSGRRGQHEISGSLAVVSESLLFLDGDERMRDTTRMPLVGKKQQ